MEQQENNLNQDYDILDFIMEDYDEFAKENKKADESEDEGSESPADAFDRSMRGV